MIRGRILHMGQRPSFELPDPEPTGLSPLQANAEMLAAFNDHDLLESDIYFDNMSIMAQIGAVQ